MAIVLEGTLQVSWFLEAIEGRMVGSLKEIVIETKGEPAIRFSANDSDAHLGR